MSLKINKNPKYFVDNPKRKMRELVGFLTHDTVTSNWPKERVLGMVAHGVKQPKGWIPGPLYNWVIFEDGEVYHIADCRSNNAGRGDRNVLKAVRNKTPIPNPKRDTINGNYYFHGVALARSGKKPIPPAMYTSLVSLLTKLCRDNNITSHGCLLHKSWTKRKVDAEKLDIWQLRKDVAANLQGGAKLTPRAPAKPVSAKPLVAVNDKGVLKALLEEWSGWTRNGALTRDIQTLVGTKADGIVGPATRAAMKKYFGA